MSFPLVAELDVDLDALDRSSDRALDLRQTERRELTHPAKVTTLGASPQAFHGEIRNLSEGGTQVRLEDPLPLFTLVRIEYDDNLLLGEVVYCKAEQTWWVVGFRIEHGLFGLAALSTAMQAF